MTDDIDTIRLPLKGWIDLFRRARKDNLAWYPATIFGRGMIRAKLLFLNTFLLNNPDHIEHVLLDNAQNYRKSVLMRRLLGPIMGNGLVVSEGDFWKRQHRIATPAFHHKRIAEFGEIMKAKAAARVASWQGRTEPFDIYPEMASLTLEVMAETMFSADIGADMVVARGLMNELVQHFQPNYLDLLGFPQWLPRWGNRRLGAAIAQFDALLAKILAPRRADGEDRGDLLSMLLLARDAETGEGMTDRQIRDEVATIFFAGHETTANALTWTWHLLAQNPAAEAKLHQEVDSVLAGRPPGFADLPSLPFCRMVFEETLRLFPSVYALSRTAVAEDHIGSVHIPAGSIITVSPYVTHRNPSLWADPEKFLPERFEPEAVAARPRFAYLPFGGGPRICIGKGMALAEAQIVIATIAQRYHLKSIPGHEAEPIGQLTLRAKNGVWVRLEERA